MAKKPLVVLFSPIGTFVHTYLDKPDSKAPEGANWKVDNKYKTKLIVEDLGDLEAQIRAYAKAEFGDKYPGDSELKTPWNEGTGEDFEGKLLITAKSQFAPEGADAPGNPLPKGVHGRAGDKGRIKFSLYAYAKTEKVQVTENGKKKTVEETFYGVSARLLGYQIVEKRAGGGGGGFSAVEGGYAADESDARPDRRSSTGPQTEGGGALDDADF